MRTVGFVVVLVAVVGGAAAPAAAPGSAPGAAHELHALHEPHELHETYADIAIEGALVGARLRFFKGQLERALGPLLDADAVDLRPGAGEADALVLRYLRDHLIVEAGGAALDPVILDSGEEELGHHRGWWVVVRWRAPAPVERLRITNRLQFGLFDDQRNMMRVVRLPGGAPETYYTAAGEEAVTVAPPG